MIRNVPLLPPGECYVKSISGSSALSNMKSHGSLELESQRLCAQVCDHAERRSICCELSDSGLQKDHHGHNADQQAACMDSQWTNTL